MYKLLAKGLKDLKTFLKNNLISSVSQGITALGESVIQGFPFIHFS